METETREFSVSILSYLEKNNQKIATDTLYKYVEAICSTFIMNRVYRYDIHGKSVLKTLKSFMRQIWVLKKLKQIVKKLIILML